MTQSILQSIKKISSTGDEVYCKIAQVKEVDTTAKTCTVAIEGEADVHNVIYAFGDTYCLTPEIDSFVLLSFLDKNTAAIIYCDKLKAVDIQINDIQFHLSETGLEVANNVTTMGKVMADLAQNVINALSAIQLFNYNYVNPAGTPTPTGPAVNASTLEIYKTNLTTLKSQLSAFIK